MKTKATSPLTDWLKDERTARYFGKTFLPRADALAFVISGAGSVADLARRNGISRQKMNRHVRRARIIFDVGV